MSYFILFYFLFERQTDVCLMEDWLYIPQVAHCSCLNICLHWHVHYASGSSSALHDFSLKPSGGTGNLVCGASSKIMLDKLLPWTGHSHNATAAAGTGQGKAGYRPVLVVCCVFLWSLLGDDHVRFSLQLHL